MRVVIKPGQKIHICMTHRTKMSKYVTCQKYLGHYTCLYKDKQYIYLLPKLNAQGN